MTSPRAPKTAADLIGAKEYLAQHAAKAREEGYRAKISALLRELQDAETRFDLLAELRQHCTPRPPIGGPRKGRGLAADKRVACAVALASDWHVEEQVKPGKVSGLNAYSPDIATRRAGRFFAGIEWLIREQQGMFAIKDLVLWLGGDMITGYIHEELLETNAMSPTEALLLAQGLISDGIHYLLAHTELARIRIPCNFGNHGRTTLRTRIGSAAANSYEWLMYTQLAHEFRAEPRIEFEIAQGHHLVTEVHGLRIHTHHGDSVRSMGGIGGILVPLTRAAVQWHAKYRADLTCVGHFHQYSSGEKIVTNGSLIGVSGYSEWLPGAGVEDPAQAFFLVDSKRGKTQCTRLWVEDRT